MDGEHALATSGGTAWRRRQRRLRAYCRFIFWLCNCDCKIYHFCCVCWSTDVFHQVHPAVPKMCAITLRTCYADDSGFLFSLTSLVLFPVWTTDRSSWYWSGPASRFLCRISVVCFRHQRRSRCSWTVGDDDRCSPRFTLNWLLVHHGLRPCLQMVNVSRSSACASMTVVSTKMCLCLRRRFCPRYFFPARVPHCVGCLHDDRYRHWHVP